MHAGCFGAESIDPSPGNPCYSTHATVTLPSLASMGDDDDAQHRSQTAAPPRPLLHALMGASSKASQCNCVRPAHLAATSRCIFMLFFFGADINVKDFWASPPLHWACKDRKDGDDRRARAWIRVGADGNSNAPYRNALHVAIKEYKFNLARALVLEGGVDPNGVDVEGTPTLVLAAKATARVPPMEGEGSFPATPKSELVKLLLEYGADVNRTDREGNSPLQTAILHDARDQTITHLLAYGADVNAVSKKGSTALMNAVELLFEAYRVPVVKLLLSHGARVSEAHGIVEKVRGCKKMQEASRALIISLLEAAQAEEEREERDKLKKQKLVGCKLRHHDPAVTT